ncbi:uncharacterized protein Z518_11124 [Rhinocladiella mackenziei CBS 650.93]|uniref:Uncharacterized protein n=1 Tax=Rhinocladiella mackenziei CBS 650.93 TaxID=1442369 RepID=A0A0D2FC77_9EURO|nr:uncharacterized protein Z518_11124 [Rhinocladiella mackenziei CBS 650.93]KIW99711.1 hypothetical protein Z518_11124 [Rhinocladiella mackenziei CBS 650.93]
MTGNHLRYPDEISLSGVKTPNVDVRSSSDSIFSDISSAPTLLDPSSFHPGTTLHISARGIGVLRLPLPSSELEIPIFNEDGSLAYTSNREKRSSGNAVLSHPKLGNLISTTYHFGPNREPELTLLQSSIDSENGGQKIKVCGRWTSRSISFMTADSHVFEWSYASTKDANGKKANILALRRKELPTAEPDGQGKIIAQLIRSDDTRTQGTSKCSAGNGGQLVLDQDATSHLDEALIVATCLMMLKKEIDRRRFIQLVAIGAAGS